MKKKKILAGLLVCALIGGAVPYNNYVMTESVTFTASAVGIYENFEYRKYSDHVEISFCDMSATEVVIPNEIEGLPVTSIGDNAFFACSLTSIIIPDSVINIGNGAFQFCALLTSITIPDSVTSIGDSAFDYCIGLTEINVSDKNKNYISKDGVLFNKDMTNLLQYPNGKIETEYIIPDGVTSIGDYAFEGCSSLTEINIPDSVTSIGDRAFRICSSLTEIKIPDGVTSIGISAFEGCSSLNEINIPDSVTSIGDGAFFSCSALKSITIKNPECEIYDSSYTISDTATIYGYENSTAQAYAKKYERNFIILGEAPTVSSETLAGDANGDGTVDIADAVAIASYVSNPEKNSLSEQGIINGDVQGNGNGINANDALAIQQYLANITKTLPVD